MTHLPQGITLQDGKYKIETVLGQGGFGITYQAKQPLLQRKVAIKEFFMKDFCNRSANETRVTTSSVGSSEIVSRFKQKFLKEAQLIASLDHPGIIRIYDVFEENDTAYFVMEYLDEGLKQKIKDSQLSRQQVIDCFRQIAAALEYLHNCNVLHLDVKPDNILFRTKLDEKKAVLIDFGISKRYDESGSQTSTTPVGVSKGFAPIEQYKQGLQNFSPATDVYSLGATLYNMLTGQTPPEASDLINEGLPVDVLDQNGVNKELIGCIEKAMSFRVKDRYASVREFQEAVEAAWDVEDIVNATLDQANDSEEQTAVITDVEVKVAETPKVQTPAIKPEKVVTHAKKTNAKPADVARKLSTYIYMGGTALVTVIMFLALLCFIKEYSEAKIIQSTYGYRDGFGTKSVVYAIFYNLAFLCLAIIPCLILFYYDGKTKFKRFMLLAISLSWICVALFCFYRFETDGLNAYWNPISIQLNHRMLHVDEDAYYRYFYVSNHFEYFLVLSVPYILSLTLCFKKLNTLTIVGLLTMLASHPLLCFALKGVSISGILFYLLYAFGADLTLLQAIDAYKKMKRNGSSRVTSV